MAELYHYGTPRHSGRYPWGSGDNPFQHESDFLNSYRKLKDQGLSEKEIADYFGMSTTELRQRNSYERAKLKEAEYAYASKLYEEGYSITAITEKLGKTSDNYTRYLLRSNIKERAEITGNIANELKECVEKDKFIDVGEGSNINLGVSQGKFDTAVRRLKDEGYTVEEIYVPQLGMEDKYTTVKVLCPPGTTRADILANKGKIVYPGGVYSNDGGKTFLGIKDPASVDSSRLQIRYAEDGGTDMDGVIMLRPGVKDLSLGGANYAQVRIEVDGTHYLKGMAIYSDDLPKGVDILFNTNKSKDVPALGEKGNTVLKLLKTDKSTGEVDKDNPFGTTLRMEDGKIVGQSYYKDENGKEHLSPINIVRQEGDWDTWSRTLASQFLAKQPIKLIKQQLKKTYDDKVDEYEQINLITQPEVKRQLLKEFAESCDSAASELKVAALPRQSAKVILPLTKLSENEIYAPGYKDGEQVALVRYPHGGIFEIPILKVNNKSPQGKELLKNAIDAVGINPKVASQLSGADFDGDTVVVIPTINQQIKNSKPLSGLANFDPKQSYPKVEGMKVMKNTQNEMGKISNLITDMTVKGANEAELARAVRHSMVVIDAEKHELNYKLSYVENGIKELKEKYQGGSNNGASTLFSLANAEIRVPARKISVDQNTGELIKTPKNTTYLKVYKDKQGNVTKTQERLKTEMSTRMKEEKDAYNLSSGTPKENAYAEYANSLKALANNARKEAYATTPTKKSSSAEKTYAKEVESLNSKLEIAVSNKPKERKAQIMANVTVSAKIRSNPELKNDNDQLKKVKQQALIAAREKAGASKKDHTIAVTEREWEALNSGAFSSSKTSQILSNMNKDRVKQLAMPKSSIALTANKIARINALNSNGYTIQEIADSIGVSVSTVSKYLTQEKYK